MILGPLSWLAGNVTLFAWELDSLAELLYRPVVLVITSIVALTLGGEHWTDTLLFRFNLQPMIISHGLRLGVEERRVFRHCRRSTIFRQIRSAMSNQVESIASCPRSFPH